MLVVVLMCVLGAGPYIPRQTQTQHEVVTFTLRDAIKASSAAEKDVWALFDSPTTKRFLTLLDDGSELQNLPSEVLIQRFWDEIQTAELVHSFGDGVSDMANCGFDLDVTIGRASEYFYNQWELQALNITPVDVVNNHFTEWSETTLFKFPPFHNTSTPDLTTSINRPFYAALNMYRGSGGNPQCGPIAAVLSPQYLAADILAAPIDTGYFQGACSHGEATGQLGNTTIANCMMWAGNRTLGTPSHMAHLVGTYLSFFNASAKHAGGEYPYMNLARLLTRLLSRSTYTDPSKALPLTFVENVFGYFELNPAVSIPFPAGVKMMIGMFEILWGTDEGTALREWCIERGWPLVWAHNPIMSFFRCGPDGKAAKCIFPPDLDVGIDQANIRLLDPYVLKNVPAGHNITLTTRVENDFERQWETVHAKSLSQDELEMAWHTLLHSTEGKFYDELAIEPLYSGACHSTQCVGVVVANRTCVCPL